MPDWYLLYKAAESMHVAPWELAKQSTFWRDKALVKIIAENEAQRDARVR